MFVVFFNQLEWYWRQGRWQRLRWISSKQLSSAGALSPVGGKYDSGPSESSNYPLLPPFFPSLFFSSLLFLRPSFSPSFTISCFLSSAASGRWPLKQLPCSGGDIFLLKNRLQVAELGIFVGWAEQKSGLRSDVKFTKRCGRHCCHLVAPCHPSLRRGGAPPWMCMPQGFQLEMFGRHNFHSDQSCAAFLLVGNYLLVAGWSLLILYKAGHQFSVWGRPLKCDPQMVSHLC